MLILDHSQTTYRQIGRQTHDPNIRLSFFIFSKEFLETRHHFEHERYISKLNISFMIL